MLTWHLILREAIAMRSPASLATCVHTNTEFCFGLNPLVQDTMQEPFSKIRISSFSSTELKRDDGLAFELGHETKLIP